jgi:hydrogenase nickel incorporation protein HypA/HybF
MHEVDMTKCLLLSMNQWKEQHSPATPVVQRVHLEVGSFTCVEPDQPGGLPCSAAGCKGPNW